ncbi:hypothetical protein HDU87_004142 [Geranomyces variabilis]|uniref:Uncharacterized protein n=1 Tax=Geranomyces variabilis TaxID=109894 RepID=A0AAD5XUL8_9FUNG|nr:hypothetical protein HDU87_004142 [Geranomyces variabilis]
MPPPIGALVWSDSQLHDLNIRTAALTLMAVNISAYWLTFRNKSSLVSRLILLLLVAYCAGDVCSIIPKFWNTPNNILTLYVGNGLFFLSAQVFNWVLYLRFNLVVPFRRWLRWFVLTWLICETMTSVGIWAFWVYATESVTGGDMTKRVLAAQIYSKFTIAQAASAMFMSAYFIKVYYWPKLVDSGASTTKSGFARLVASGFLYLIAESVLHLAFLVLYYITPTYYSSLTSLFASIRFLLFLVFVYQIRDASTRSAASKISMHSGRQMMAMGDTDRDSLMRRAATLEAASPGTTTMRFANSHAGRLHDEGSERPRSSLSMSRTPYYGGGGGGGSASASGPQPAHPPPAHPPPSPYPAMRATSPLPARAIPGYARPPAQVTRVTVHTLGRRSSVAAMEDYRAMASPTGFEQQQYLQMQQRSSRDYKGELPDYDYERLYLEHVKGKEKEFEVKGRTKRDDEEGPGDWPSRFVRKS